MSELDPNVGAAAPASAPSAPAAPAAPAAAPTVSVPTVKPAEPPEPPAALMPAVNKDEQLDAELAAVWDEKISDDDAGELEAPAVTRDPSGRFVSTKPADPNQDQAPDETGQETPPASIQAPPSWSGERAALFAQLPPAAQEYVAQRESQAHRAITQAGQRLKAYEPLDQLVRENSDHFQQHGISPTESFKSLLAAQRHLEKDPVGGLVQVGLSYGIDLRPLLGSGGLEDQGAGDPVVTALQRELQEIKGHLTAQQKREQEAQAHQAQAQRQELVQSVTSWGTQKGEDGAPLRPHFNAVRPMMAALIRSGQAEGLDDAYDMAVHASPAIRKQVLAAQREPETRAAAMAKAKRAGALNVRSAPATATPKSLDDELNAIASKHYR